ncbi:MAG TPA: DUF4347 domain-containing protein [Planctomycetaceae bacterium]|jgi:hypothetical protein|nr:DUF4347 domain-containing protein [Planctomycetaceae bacterium]
MAGNENAIRDLSRRVDVVEDLLHVLARTGPAPSPTIITDQGETNSVGPAKPVRVSVDRTDNAFQTIHDICEGASNKRSNDFHSSTKEAFANLYGGSADITLLVGHGRSGRINTGSGLSMDTDPNQHMDMGNVGSWKDCVSSDIPGTRLVLFACQVAAGIAGRDFLQEVAIHAKREVGGWTCFPAPGLDGNLKGHGNFLVAHPSGNPPVVAEDCAEYYDGRRDIEVLKLRTPNGYEEVGIRSIQSVNFTPVGNDPELPKAFTLQPSEADRLLKLIDFAHPVRMSDKLPSIHTGQLTIMFERGKGPECRVFHVLGDSLLQDAWFLNTHYHASHRLLPALHGR